MARLYNEKKEKHSLLSDLKDGQLGVLLHDSNGFKSGTIFVKVYGIDIAQSIGFGDCHSALSSNTQKIRILDPGELIEVMG